MYATKVTDLNKACVRLSPYFVKSHCQEKCLALRVSDVRQSGWDGGLHLICVFLPMVFSRKRSGQDAIVHFWDYGAGELQLGTCD